MEKFKNYLILALLISLGTVIYLNYDKEPIPDKVVITEEKTGGVEKKLSGSIPDTVYIPVPVLGNSKQQIKQVVVDSTYKAEYESALKENDSLKAKNLFLESIALDTFEGTLIDNDDITIDGRFKTRGKLLEYDIDYNIKSDTLTFKPNIEYRYPKLSIIYGANLGMPSTLTGAPTLEAVVGFQGKKGGIITVGFNTEQRVSVGYYKTIKLLK